MKFLAQWLSEGFVVGQYNPTENFKSITNHSCVCKPNLDLIALTGDATNEESQKLADLFSAAPDLYYALDSILYNCNSENIKVAEAALKKARGGI